MSTFKQYVSEILIDKLNQDFNISDIDNGVDLAFTLLEAENIDGTITYSREESKQLIIAYFEEFGDIVEEYENNFGEKFPYSPFSDPEKFVCCAAIVEAENILCDYNQGMTNKQIIKMLE